MVTSRKGWKLRYVSRVTWGAVAVLGANIALWLDFLRGLGRGGASSQGWFTDLFRVSTNFLLCLFILPFFLIKKGLCRCGMTTTYRYYKTS